MEKKHRLDELKQKYEKLRKEHNLPSFKEINEDFNIERISEIETDLLIREIRKFLAERFSNYMRFVEALLNPVNVQMFVFSIIKTLEAKEKEKLKEIYKKLAKREIALVELDLKFSEEKEVQFIKESYAMWQEIKKDLLSIISRVKENVDNKLEQKNKDYFG